MLSPQFYFVCTFFLNKIIFTIYFLLQTTNTFLVGPTMIELLGCKTGAKLKSELRAAPMSEWGPP